MICQGVLGGITCILIIFAGTAACLHHKEEDFGEEEVEQEVDAENVQQEACFHNSVCLPLTNVWI